MGSGMKAQFPMRHSTGTRGSHPASTTLGAEQLPHVPSRAQHGPESASPEALGTSKPILGQKSVN